MGVTTRGFHGHEPSTTHKLPPGQHESRGFPVLSAGPTPHIPLDRWQFTITTEHAKTHAWSWPQFLGLPQEEIERRYGEPPWVLLNEIFEASGLPFRAVFPTEIRPTSLIYDDTFAVRLQDVERGMEGPFEGLSSGKR